MAIDPTGTIYQDETGFNEGLKIEIDPVKMKFIRELKTSRTSSIFFVKYRGKPRVLKVVSSISHHEGCYRLSDNV